MIEGRESQAMPRGGRRTRRASALLLAAAVFAAALALAAAAGGAAAKDRTAPRGKVYTWTFQADTLGQEPEHSKVFGGVWQVTEEPFTPAESDSAAPSPPGMTPADSLPPAKRILSQLDDGEGKAYHYLSFTRPLVQDLDASVRFRIRSGEVDPTAGLLFQMDPKGTSGYLVRVSGKGNELVFHYLLYGKRRDVRFVKIDAIEPNTWHTLSIVRRRSVLQASLDGKEILKARDDRFSRGTVGVWTEEDTVVDFADLTVVAR